MKRVVILLFSLMMVLSGKDYTTDPKVVKSIDLLVTKHGLDRERLETLFSDVSVQESALKFYLPKVKKKRTPQEIARLKKLYPKYGSWDRYAKYKVTDTRAKQGIAFLKEHQKIFNEVEKIYAIPKEYIAAVIGIETVYGRNVGKYPVFDTLATLAYEKNRRNSFFGKELQHFLRLSHTEGFDPTKIVGSYAGAIGLGQFMPSSFNAFGVDFDKDGKLRLDQPTDAIASVANYLKKNGWRKGEPIATRVRYKGMRFNKYKTGYKKTYRRIDLKGIAPRKKWNYNDKVRLIKLNREKYDELWYGAKNFYVITRYNHSSYYAMSVHQLAVKIKEKLHEN